MIQTEFLHFWRELNSALYWSAQPDASFGEAWPLWQDGASAANAARVIVAQR
jgi:hypothetical protein